MKQIALSDTIQTLLDGKRHSEIFTHHHGRVFQRVDFKNQVVLDGFNAGQYCIMLDDVIQKDIQVACILPNRPGVSEQVMQSTQYRSLESFNRDLNARLRESLEFTDGIGTTKLAVCFGNHAFACLGITGTVYVLWAKHISFTNQSNVASIIHSNVPIVVNMDGRMMTKGIFILKAKLNGTHSDDELSRIPITKDSPELLFPLYRDIFVCENRMPRAKPKRIKTLSLKSALARVLSPDKASTASASQEVNPFASSIDVEEDAMGWIVGGGGASHSMTYGSDPDAGSPRPEIFCQEINVDLRRLDATPPIADSDDDVPPPPDPFVSIAKEKEEIV